MACGVRPKRARSAYGVRWWSRKQRSKRPQIQSFKHPFGGAVCFRDPQEVIDGCIPNHDMLSRHSALGNLNERHRNDMRLRGCTPMDMHPLERENLAVCAARPPSAEARGETQVSVNKAAVAMTWATSTRKHVARKTSVVHGQFLK